MVKFWIIQTEDEVYVGNNGVFTDDIKKAKKWRSKEQLPEWITMIDYPTFIKKEKDGTTFYYSASFDPDDENSMPIAEARLLYFGVYTQIHNGVEEKINVFDKPLHIK